MTLRYHLSRLIIHPQFELEITESDYTALSSARKTLMDAHAFEQKFDLLKENFIALETAATTWSLRATVEHQYSYLALSQVLREANRHVVNLLSSARAYVDQIRQDFSHLGFSPPFGEMARLRLSAEYDASKEYRFMEALRNHVQHNALPAHGFCGSTPKGPNDWVVAVSVRAFKTTLAEDPKFKPRVLAEMGDFVDLRDCARTYVRSLSTVHIGLRTMLTKVFEEARSLIETWTHRYREEGNDSALGLAAIRSVNGTRDASSIPLLLDWDDVRAALSRVNSAPIQFDR